MSIYVERFRLLGVIIGDMGHKVGLNGLDNGWMRFSHYKIDRNAQIDLNNNCLLDELTDEYLSIQILRTGILHFFFTFVSR